MSEPTEENTLRLQLKESERENAGLRAKVADLEQADTINLLQAKLRLAYERTDRLNEMCASVRAALHGRQVPDGMDLGKGVILVLARYGEDVRMAVKDLREAQRELHEWRSRYVGDVAKARKLQLRAERLAQLSRRRERIDTCNEILDFLDRRAS